MIIPCFPSAVQASLVVNVASYSQQTEANYISLQELHRELGTSHFNVLAFPCGQFGDTETGTSRDIEAFAKSTYGVTFPFFSRIKIMGSEADPAFRFLTGWQKKTTSVCCTPDMTGGQNILPFLLKSIIAFPLSSNDVSCMYDYTETHCNTLYTLYHRSAAKC